MEDWIQIIIVIAAWVLTVQQSRKRSKRKKRIAELRKATVNPTVVLDGADIGSQSAAVPRSAMTPISRDRQALGSDEYAAPQADTPTIFQSYNSRSGPSMTVPQSESAPISQTGPDGIERGAPAQQSTTSPVFQNASLSGYADETPGVQEPPTIIESTLTQSANRRNFNAFERSAAMREMRADSIKNTEIASVPGQAEQSHDMGNVNFDLRQAVIYSEILTAKYKDYF